MSGGRHAEAVEAYRRSMFSATEGYTQINYEMAKSLVASKRPGEAAHYREVVRAWEKGDPPFQFRRRTALDWLAEHVP